MHGGGRGLSSRAAHDGGRDVGTGVSLSGQRVQRRRYMRNEAPGFRFYSERQGWRDVGSPSPEDRPRNGGAAGVDAETVRSG